MKRSLNMWLGIVTLFACVMLVAAFARSVPSRTARPSTPQPPVTRAQVLLGRRMVIEHDCGGCHGGDTDPDNDNWLVGMKLPVQEFLIGKCSPQDPNAQPCFHTRPKNLTPDAKTGIGSFTERQLFNALRYGLRPEDTPDVLITSHVPGKGNFPKDPKYLAPPMPWTAWRYMTDAQLWAIAAYLKHGLKPVVNKVEDSEGPPDFWASAYTDDEFGTMPNPRPFPTKNETFKP